MPDGTSITGTGSGTPMRPDATHLQLPDESIVQITNDQLGHARRIAMLAQTRDVPVPDCRAHDGGPDVPKWVCHFGPVMNGYPTQDERVR